jgi:glycosyltransferase involved in cell wall biosynthesis
MYSKISILLPTFNSGKNLFLAVKSIINQSFENWALLILDDGSTDNSLKEINNLREKRIKIFKNKINKGISYRLNQGIKLSKTKYIARMDSDDIAFPNRLQKQFNFLEKNKDIDLLSSKACFFLDENYQISGFLPYKKFHDSIIDQPWRTIFMPHPTWMGRTKWFKKNLYKIPPAHLAEDQELLLRTMIDSKFYSLPNVLLAYRKSKFSFYKNLKSRVSLLKSQLKYFFKNKKITFLILAINLFFFKLIIDLTKSIIVFLKINLIKNYNNKKPYEINNNFNNLVNLLKKK